MPTKKPGKINLEIDENVAKALRTHVISTEGTMRGIGKLGNRYIKEGLERDGVIVS